MRVYLDRDIILTACTIVGSIETAFESVAARASRLDAIVEALEVTWYSIGYRYSDSKTARKGMTKRNHSWEL